MNTVSKESFSLCCFLSNPITNPRLTLPEPAFMSAEYPPACFGYGKVCWCATRVEEDALNPHGSFPLLIITLSFHSIS